MIRLRFSRLVKQKKSIYDDIPMYLRGAQPEDDKIIFAFISNGAEQLKRENITDSAEIYENLGGNYELCVVEKFDKCQALSVRNYFTHHEAKFIGYQVRKKENGVWKWLAEDGIWYENQRHMPKLLLLNEKDTVKFQESGKAYILEAKWELADGTKVNNGYKMFLNPLMAHAFGAMNGKTYHNTVEAYEHGKKLGYKYFEVDISKTADDKLVLCHGWSKANCRWTGIKFYSHFSHMPYRKLKRLKVHGNKIPPIRKFVKIMKKDTKSLFEIDFHNIDGEAAKKRVGLLVDAFHGEKELLDRLLIQAYSKEMFQAMNEQYRFKHYQFLVGNDIGKLDDIINYCLDNGICALALRMQFAKPEFLEKIKNAGLYSLCYTLNDDIVVAQRLLDTGANTICTDYITKKDLEENKERIGHHPFYIYYHGSREDTKSNYPTINKTKRGMYEYRDAGIVNNDGEYTLVKNQYYLPGYKFVGWRMRINIEGEELWYTKNRGFCNSKEIKKRIATPYLFQDEEKIGQWNVKKNMRVVMVATWKKVKGNKKG